MRSTRTISQVQEYVGGARAPHDRRLLNSDKRVLLVAVGQRTAMRGWNPARTWQNAPFSRSRIPAAVREDNCESDSKARNSSCTLHASAPGWQEWMADGRTV